MNISSAQLRIDRTRSNLAAEAEVGANLPSMLVDEWRAQLVKYQTYWQWMDGRVWEEVDKFATVPAGRDKPKLFPIQLNPLYTAAIIHRNTLFGEVSDTGGPMVRPLAQPKRFGIDADNKEAIKSSIKDAQFVTDLLEMLWYQSNGRSEMLDAGFVSQAIGGFVWKVSYEPWNKDLIPGLPVAFRQIEPEFFLPIYSMHDRWHLRGARLGRMIDGLEAKEVYGVDIGSSDRALYLESWDRERVDVTVNGQPAVIRRSNSEIPLSADHGYGLVPFVYGPHELVGQFYGVPIVHEIANLLKELNGRTADVGDAVRNSIERLIILTNADAGEIDVKNIGEGLKVIATGREMQGTQGKKVDLVDSPALPTGTMEFIQFLRSETWHGMFTPAVAYGEDEGSQRSALTLAFRMWPLTSHIRSERSVWTDALRVMSDYALRILNKKQKGDYGDLAEGTPWRVEGKHLGHMINMDWATMIPRDRESEINQLILRHADEQLSTESALEKSGDIQDIAQELERISKEREDRLKTESKFAAKTAPGQQGAQTDNRAPVARTGAEPE